MIHPSKYLHALQALHEIFVEVRCIGYKLNNKELIDICDTAETLPEDIAAPEDRTESFRFGLEGIAQKSYRCNGVLERFDMPEVIFFPMNATSESPQGPSKEADQCEPGTGGQQ